MRRASDAAPDVALLIALTVTEGCLLAGVATAAGRGRVFAAAVVLGLAAALVGGWRVARGLSTNRRALGMTVAMNAFTVALAAAGAESVLRVLATRLPHGTYVGGRLLLPRRWEDVAAYHRELLARARPNISYLVADETLGWTIAPARLSSNGLYASSAEGIRSARPGTRYAGTEPLRRVALVGDSYTFGLEVPFQSTWGHRLERALGDGFQVLNFGVDGYGVDQAYLRFDRDVRPFAPRVVVCGFIRHDLYRTMAVYPFIDFPTWGLPFAKPRLTRAASGIEAQNLPLPRPEAIFAAARISDLGFLDLDAGYWPGEWRARPYAFSYLARWLLSGLETARRPSSEDEMISLNAEILATLARAAREDGAVPVVAYFPSRFDFRPIGGDGGKLPAAVFAALRARGVEPLDTTPCLAALGEERLFLPGRPHYSTEGNERLAACLLPAVRAAAVR